MARYFLSQLPPPESDHGTGSYWGGSSNFEGWSKTGDTYAAVLGSDSESVFNFQKNLHMLAYSRGDRLPAADPTRVPVAPQRYHVLHSDPLGGDPPDDFFIDLQPFVQADDESGTNAVAFPIGDFLREFLDDPLGIGGSLKLALPFQDERVTLRSAWMREKDDVHSIVHGGFDFSAPMTQRPLHDVHAAADGVVAMLLYAESGGHMGGVLLSHTVGSDRFYTLYQHLQPPTVTLAVGDHVTAGSKLGTIRQWIEDDGDDISHNHFDLLVSSRGFDLNGTEIPALWYAIDPFGVYDYHGDNPTYIPPVVGGITEPIQGAERTIQWAGNPPILALPVELTTDYLRIRKIQVRVRTKSDATTPLPPERDQVFVKLDGLDDYFFVTLDPSLDRPIETEMIKLLRRSYTMDKPVKLGYRMYNGERKITAVWVGN